MRQECIERSRSEIQDCLVIGAGINGAVAAAALSGKGAKVTLVDKWDFASFTSQESSNLVWGGIKYLEAMQFRLVWKLCKCRNQLMEVYPSRVKEVRFFTTLSRGFRMPYFLVYLGALLYWAMGRFRTRPPALLTRSAIRRRAPMVRAGRIAGGLEYSDGLLIENDARFTFGFVRKTLDHGGSPINYMELVGAERREGLWHCRLRDRVSEETVEIKARALVNAGGPFADGVNRMLGIESSYHHVLSKGVHIIVPRVFEERVVMTFFASDGRLFFMIPMGSRTCIGTTDTRVESAAVEATPEDIDFLLENANNFLDLERSLTRADIVATRCGVRPLAVDASTSVDGVAWTELSRKHEITPHADEGTVTIYGGKITDCLNVGNEVAELMRSLEIDLPNPDATWFGEPGTSEADRFKLACGKAGVEERVGRRLWRRYGMGAFGLVERIDADPAMGEPLLEHCLRVEIHHIAETEMVVHLDDFLRRRTMLALTVKKEDLRKSEGLKETAEILFGENASAEFDLYFRDAPAGT